jgi:Pectate lyase superfamily protein
VRRISVIYLPAVVLVMVVLAVGVWMAYVHRSSEVVNLRSFGAAGDGISDDGPALQRALDALATAGGGSLHVPPGRYVITTPVTKNFSEKAAAIAIEGNGRGTAIEVAGNATGLNLTSEFIIKSGQERVALTLGGLDTLLIRDIAFSGDKDVRNDALVVLEIHDIGRARIEHCEFYGLASLTMGGSIVAAYGSGLSVDGTAFLGCATNSAHSASMIRVQAWTDVAVINTKFIDYGNRPAFYSKTPLGSPYSWIGIGDAQVAQSESEQRNAVIRNVFLDEGAFIGITARRESSSTPFNVFISAIRMNVSNLAACGIYLSGAEKVRIERSRLGWSHNADAAIILKNVSDAVLDRVECVDGANTIRADAETERLLVINSRYKTLDSAAPYTRTQPQGSAP